MITLTPLSSSAASSSSSEPVCYLLELDEARILLDLGQRDYRSSAGQSSWDYEEKVRELAPTLSLVLLSHSPSSYLSLYPYARAHWGLQCPVYATQPTVEMGRVVCLAEVESWRGEHAVAIDSKEHQDESEEAGSSNGEKRLDKGKKPLRGPFVATVEEVHEAFDWVKAIRYNQPLHLGGELSHLLLTPFPSGHTLGGTLFKLRSPTSGTVLYALGINHTGERHLDGMVGGHGGASGYAEGVLRPDLLIVEGGRSQVVNPKRRDREAALIDLVTNTLESERSVLLPVDPSPRLLELLVLLDQHWTFKLQPQSNRQQRPWSYPLCLVSRTGQDMISFARSLIEWMGGVIRDSSEDEVLESRRNKRGRKRGGAGLGSEYGALDFRHVQFFSSPTELLQAHPLSRPKLVLAIPPSISHGPSRWLFTAMASTEGNVIVLTSRGEDGTLSRDLYDRWESQQDEAARWGKGRIGHVQDLEGRLPIEINSKVPLAGAELEAHLEVERVQKEREAAQQATLNRTRQRMLEADDLDTDSESGSDADEDAADGIIIARTDESPEERLQQMSFDIYVKGQQTRVGRIGGGGGGGEMARFRMFPFIERRGRKVDEYGEGIDVGLWVRRGREIEEEGETEEVREKKKRKVEEDEKQKAPPEPPSKFVSETASIDLKASVFYVDMDGLHDGQAIKTIVSDLQPRKLILVRSSQESTESLLSFFKGTSVTKDVYAPKNGEEIRIGEHVASYSIMLGDSISNHLSAKWSKFEGYEVAMLDGIVALSAGSTVPTLEAAGQAIATITELKQETAGDIEDTKPTTGEGVDSSEIDVKMEPDLEPIAMPEKPAAKPMTPGALPGSLFVGDLRLANLKQRLSTLSPPIPAEFAGEGILICGEGISQGENAKGGSIVAVRKLAEGQIVLEGGIGKTYTAVRTELYKGFARVTAA